jgi:hypothetical protein
VTRAKETTNIILTGPAPIRADLAAMELRQVDALVRLKSRCAPGPPLGIGTKGPGGRCMLRAAPRPRRVLRVVSRAKWDASIDLPPRARLSHQGAVAASSRQGVWRRHDEMAFV